MAEPGPAPIPVRRRSRPPSRYLPRGLVVPSPETFDENVNEIQSMFPYTYELDAVVAALYQASNSVQVAVNVLLGGNVRPLPSLGQVAVPILVDARHSEASAVSQVRGILMHQDGLTVILQIIRSVLPQTAAAIEGNAIPFLFAVGLPVTRTPTQAAYQVLPSADLPAYIQDGWPTVERLTRLGYSGDAVMRAIQAGVENLEQRLRGDE